MMRRPRTTTISPDALESGSIGQQTGTSDAYFRSADEATLRIIIDNFMAQLPEPQKSAVQMCIMHRMSYEEAAEYISIQRGRRTDKKTVWRWGQQGLEMMRDMLERAQWASQMEPRVPNG